MFDKQLGTMITMWQGMIPKNINIDTESLNACRTTAPLIIPRYFCRHCNYSSMDREHLLEHEDVEHELAGIIFGCLICQYRTNKADQFYKHLRKHNDDKKLAANETRFLCKLCKFVAKSMATLKNHQKQKHTTKIFKCSSCSFKTMNQSFMKRHRTHKHTEIINMKRVYKCDYCNHRTTRVEFLTSHMRRSHFIFELEGIPRFL